MAVLTSVPIRCTYRDPDGDLATAGTVRATAVGRARVPSAQTVVTGTVTWRLTGGHLPGDAVLVAPPDGTLYYAVTEIIEGHTTGPYLLPVTADDAADGLDLAEWQTSADPAQVPTHAFPGIQGPPGDVNTGQMNDAIAAASVGDRDLANATGNLPYSQVSGLATLAHTGAYGDLLNPPTIPTTFDQLGGMVPQSAIPALYLEEFLGEVASQSAMLALTGQIADWCYRSDTESDWQIVAADTTQVSSWRERVGRNTGVRTVAGRKGAVTLTYADIGGLGSAATCDVGTTPGTVADGSTAANPRAWTLYTPGSEAVGQVPTWNGTTYVPSAGGGYSDEQAQDAAAALLTGQTGKVSATYDDAANRITLGLSGLSKSDVGLGNVDNTADTAKPVSTAVASALAGKSNTGHTHPVTDLTATGTPSASTYLRGDNTWATPSGGGGDLAEYSRIAQTAALAASALPGKTARFNTTGGAITQPVPLAAAGTQLAVGHDTGTATFTIQAASRTDTATVTSGSATVTDSAILAADQGRLVTGTGIPAATYVGTVTAGTSFKLSSSPTSQVDVTATAAGTSVVISDVIGSGTATSLALQGPGEVLSLHCTTTGHYRVYSGFRTSTLLDSVYVKQTQRGPIGGVNDLGSIAAAGTVTPNADTALRHRGVLAGSTATLALPTGGTDGEDLTVELNATTACVVTIGSGYELSTRAPTRTYTIGAGGWSTFRAILRSGTWRLVDADPQRAGSASVWTPDDHSLLGWSMDPAAAPFGAAPSSGIMFIAAVKVAAPGVCTGALINIVTAGATLTSARNLLGLYTVAGARVAQSADQSTAWTSAGLKQTPWSATATLTPGWYYVAGITTGTTPAQFSYPGASPIGAIAYGLPSGTYRGAYSSATQTTMPTTLPAMAAAWYPMWVALY